MRHYLIIAAVAALLTVCSASAAAASALQQQQRADSEEKLQEVIDNALKAIDKLDELVETQTETTKEVVAKIVRKGYDKFTESTKVNKISNLANQFYDRFVEIQMVRLKISQSDLAEVRKNLFQKIKEAKPGKWVAHKLLYSPSDKPSSTKYISVLGYVRENANFDLVVIDVTSAVELAKDLLVIQTKETGDLTVEKEETETERLPEGSGLEKSDVTLVLNFFQAIAIRALARVA